jgi:hypothetical protein
MESAEVSKAGCKAICAERHTLSLPQRRHNHCPATSCHTLQFSPQLRGQVKIVRLYVSPCERFERWWVALKCTVFSDVMFCALLDVYVRLRGTSCLHLHGKKSQDSIITIIMIIIQLFVHLHAELNSQMPITESIRIQRNNNRADTRAKKKTREKKGAT